MVFFEAPHRVLKTMTELSEMGLDDRLCVCCRELSKIHEEIWRGSIKEAVTWLSHRSDAENRIRGEFTIILGPWIPKGLSKVEAINQIQLYLEKLESDGVSRSEAVAIVTDKNGVLAGGWEFRKSDVYKIALNMNWNEVKRKEM